MICPLYRWSIDWTEFGKTLGILRSLGPTLTFFFRTCPSRMWRSSLSWRIVPKQSRGATHSSPVWCRRRVSKTLSRMRSSQEYSVMKMSGSRTLEKRNNLISLSAIWTYIGTIKLKLLSRIITNHWCQMAYSFHQVWEVTLFKSSEYVWILRNKKEKEVYHLPPHHF